MAHQMVGVLGRLQVTRANAPVRGLESDKTRALNAHLATEADEVHVEGIVAVRE